MKSLKLKDGRILAYEEYGDPKGKPVFYFHGWPASRLSGQKIDPIAKKFKIRLISPDRPGMGFSTIKPGRKLLDWPEDVTALAEHLKIKKFSVVGSSGGAPYVLACAYKIPECLVSVTVIAGLGPLREKSGLSLLHYLMLKTAVLGGKIAPLFLYFYKYSLDYFPSMFIWSTLLFRFRKDKELIREPKNNKFVLATSKESFRQGIKGPWLDSKIITCDWGFNLEDIKTEVALWHGKKDRNVPFWLGKCVASRLKYCKANFVENAGHSLIAQKGEEIFSEI